MKGRLSNQPPLFVHMRHRSAWRAVLGLGAAAAVSIVLAAQTQTPTFRAGVDVIAVDVQVVDGSGQPIDQLPVGKFSVTIDGHDRRIVSVDQVRYSADADGAAPMPAIVAGPSARNDWPGGGPVNRMFLLAFDVGSFSLADSRRAAEAARVFVDRLQANDVVGLYSYPFGPRIQPTADRQAVRSALDTLMGGTKAMASQYHLTPAEVIDINAEIASIGATPQFGLAAQRGGTLASAVGNASTDTFRRVLLRECGSENDLQCAQNIEREAGVLAFYYEGEVTRQVNDLTNMMGVLGTLPGRKTLVVFSAGMAAADRPGARPNVDDLARQLGESAARTNTTIYTLFFDSTSFEAMSPETRKANAHPTFQAREGEVLSRFLDQFARTSGGAMMRVVVGAGETALGRILRETSAYYLLGVAPAASDRDGRVHRLKVRVDSHGATVRSRTFVQIPQRGS
jgi:VWFA-related protein